MSDYIPEPVPSWTDIVAAKDAEIKRLRAALRGLLSEFGYTLPNGTKDMIRTVLGELNEGND